MQNLTSILSSSDILPEGLPFLREDMLFFDIETTGLSSSASIIYCIGTGCLAGDRIRIEVSIIDSDREEEELLLRFSEKCAGFAKIVTFNGDRFDLPFVRERAQAYGLPDPFEQTEPFDLYRKSRSFRRLLPLEHYRQKSFEGFLGISREDPYSGGELIRVYHRYQHTHQDGDLTDLYMHNYEDVKNMFSLLALLSYDAFVSGDWRITEIARHEDACILRAALQYPVPQTVRILREDGNLVLRDGGAFFELPVQHRILRHYFKNYKDYYYLPEEGIAVHKSVGAYVAPERRERARKSNCFAQKECDCLHAAASSGLDYLKENEKDRSTWLALPAELSEIHEDDWKEFIKAWLKSSK